MKNKRLLSLMIVVAFVSSMMFISTVSATNTYNVVVSFKGFTVGNTGYYYSYVETGPGTGTYSSHYHGYHNRVAACFESQGATVSVTMTEGQSITIKIKVNGVERFKGIVTILGDGSATAYFQDALVCSPIGNNMLTTQSFYSYQNYYTVAEVYVSATLSGGGGGGGGGHWVL